MSDQDQQGGLALGGDDSATFDAALQNMRRRAMVLNPDPRVDLIAQRGNGALPSYAEIRKELNPLIERERLAGEETLAHLEHPPLDERIPYLKAAAGMLSPTKTGSFGESLGYGISGYGSGLEDISKQRQDFYKLSAAQRYKNAHDILNDTESAIKTATGPEQIQSMIDIARSRLTAQRYKFVATRGLFDTMAAGGPQLVKGTETLTMAQLQTQAQKNIDRYISQQKVFTDPAAADKERVRLYKEWEDRLSNDPDSVFARLAKGDAAAIGLPPGAKLDADPAAVVPPAPAPAPAAAVPPAPVPAPAPAPAAAPAAPAAPVPAPAAANAAAIPPVPVYPKGSPQLAQDVKKAQEYADSENKFEEELRGSHAAAITANRSLTEIEDAIKSGTPGMGAALFAAISKLRLQAGIGSDRDKERAASFEQADKISGGFASQFIKQISNRPTQMEFLLANTRFVPNMEMTPEGAKRVIGIMRQTNNLSAEESLAYYKWKTENPRGNYRQFNTQWMEDVAKRPLVSDDTHGGGAIPEGVPPGSKVVGYEKGTKNQVWEAPDKKQYVVRH